MAKVDPRRRRTTSRCGGEREPRSVLEGVLRGPSRGAAEVMVSMAACSALVSSRGAVEGGGEEERRGTGAGGEEEGKVGGPAAVAAGADTERPGRREASLTGSKRKSRPGSAAAGRVSKSRSMSTASATPGGATLLDVGNGSSGIGCSVRGTPGMGWNRLGCARSGAERDGGERRQGVDPRNARGGDAGTGGDISSADSSGMEAKPGGAE